jgi:hypothetical protein
MTGGGPPGPPVWVAVGVAVFTGPTVAVSVGVGDGPNVAVKVGVGEGPDVAVKVGVGDGPEVAVNVGVGEGPDVAVNVGVGDGPNVAVKVGVGEGPRPHAALETLLLSIVTAPFRARALPGEMLAAVVSVMLVRARMFPANAVPVPSVAELPTCQNTLQLDPMLLMTTLALLAVVSVLPIWKTKTAAGLP